MFKNLKYIKLYDILSIFIFPLLIIPSLFYKLYLKITGKKIWLITEDGRTARDNGYYFFRYMREEHKDFKAYYVISKKSPDYKKVAKYGNIVRFRSIKHWIYYLSCKYNISSQKNGNPAQALFYVLHVKLNLFNNRVFLQHGIIMNDNNYVHYSETKFKYFICGAEKEYEYVKSHFGYPEGSVLFTGLARHDYLTKNVTVKNNQILIMPTWRSWLGRETNRLSKQESFTETEFYKNWNGLLNDKEFIDFIEANNIKVKFYPHINMQKYLSCFKPGSSNIELVSADTDIQKMLKESALMITDYTSATMDFALLKKPIIYFQFDQKEFQEKQYHSGYFSYEKDGFGPVANTIGTVVKSLKASHSEKLFVANEKYLKRMDAFFLRNDQKNSEKIYDKLDGSPDSQSRREQRRAFTEKLLVYLSMIACFASVFTIYFYYTITPVMVAGFLILLYRIIFKVKQNKRLQLPELLYLLFYVFTLLSLLWSYNLGNSIKISVKVAAIIVSIIQYRALYSNADKEVVEKAFRQLSVLYILLTFVLYISCLAALNFNFNRANMDMIGLTIDRRMPRLVTISNSDPNISCVFLSMPLIYFLYSFNKNSSKRRKIVDALLVILYASAIVLTLSRGGIIAMAAIGFVYLIFGGKGIKSRIAILSLTTIAIVALMFSSSSLMSSAKLPSSRAAKNNPSSSKTIVNRFTSIQDDGGSGRLRIWNNALQTFKKHPVAGIGIGSTRRYSADNYKEDHYVHNTFLEVLSETGIIGFVLFFASFIVIAIRSLISSRKDRAFSLLIFTSLTVSALFISMQYSDIFYIHLLAIILCTSSVGLRNKKELKIDEE